MHDVIKTKQGGLIALLADQQGVDAVFGGAGVMDERRLNSVKADHRGGHGQADTGIGVLNRFQTQRIDLRAIAIDQFRALARGQNAGRLIALKALVFGHGAARAGAKCTVDPRVIESFPLQRLLQQFAAIGVQLTLTAPCLGGGFFNDFDDLDGFFNGLFDLLFDDLLDLGGFGGFYRCRGDSRRCANGPELLAIVATIGHEGIAGDLTGAAHIAQLNRGLIHAKGANRNRIPPRGQLKPVHSRAELGAVHAGALLGLAQGRLCLNLNPGRVLCLNRQCQNHQT